MSSPSSPPRFQFSMRWMLVAMTVVALVLGFGGTPLVGIVLRSLLPTVALAAAIYGREDIRAFAIGATVGSIPIFTADIGAFGMLPLVLGTISQFVVMGICGAAAVVTRRWLGGHGRPDNE